MFQGNVLPPSSVSKNKPNKKPRRSRSRLHRKSSLSWLERNCVRVSKGLREEMVLLKGPFCVMSEKQNLFPCLGRDQQGTTGEQAVVTLSLAVLQFLSGLDWPISGQILHL
jgi:hypothetical protein